MCSIDAGRSSIVKTASGNPSLQSLKVESRATDAIVPPWGAIARAFTSPVWPIRLNRAASVSTSQILIALSFPPVASSCHPGRLYRRDPALMSRLFWLANLVDCQVPKRWGPENPIE